MRMVRPRAHSGGEIVSPGHSSRLVPRGISLFEQSNVVCGTGPALSDP
jgi:hypothetical protein